jgi:hypothetical protein
MWRTYFTVKRACFRCVESLLSLCGGLVLLLERLVFTMEILFTVGGVVLLFAGCFHYVWRSCFHCGDLVLLLGGCVLLFEGLDFTVRRTCLTVCRPSFYYVEVLFYC